MSFQGTLRICVSRLAKSPGSLFVLLGCLLIGPGLAWFGELSPIKSSDSAHTQAWLHLAAILGASGAAWSWGDTQTAFRAVQENLRTAHYIALVALVALAPALLAFASLQTAGFAPSPLILAVIPPKCAVWTALAAKLSPNSATIPIASLWFAGFVVPQALPLGVSEVLALPIRPDPLTQALAISGIAFLAFATPRLQGSKAL